MIEATNDNIRELMHTHGFDKITLTGIQFDMLCHNIFIDIDIRWTALFIYEAFKLEQKELLMEVKSIKRHIHSFVVTPKGVKTSWYFAASNPYIVCKHESFAERLRESESIMEALKK